LAPRLVGAWPTRRALGLLRPLFPSEKGVRLLGVTVSGFEEMRGGTDQLGFCFPVGKGVRAKGWRFPVMTGSGSVRTLPGTKTIFRNRRKAAVGLAPNNKVYPTDIFTGYVTDLKCQE
jgi:hypothetical protein